MINIGIIMSEKEKHAGGRPPKFESVEELENLVEAYFLSLEYEDNETGEIKSKSPTITGLTLFLGFCSKTSLYEYEKKPEFMNSIKRARLMVEEGYERALLTKGSTGAIFALKNFGWKDKVEQDIKAEVISDTKEMTTEELLLRAQAVKQIESSN